MKRSGARIGPLHRIEGIVVKTIDYQEYDKILHVFTPSDGMRSLIAKRARHHRSRGVLAAFPFLHAQFVFECPEKQLPVCREISPIAHYLELRENSGRLSDACKMASLLYGALLPGKQAPLLFALFKSYLDRTVETQGSRSLVASFYLKLLRHEGVFTLPLCCAECGCETAGFYASSEGFFCASHTFERTLFFSPLEAEMLYLLMYSRQFLPILQTSIDEGFFERIERLCKIRLFL